MTHHKYLTTAMAFFTLGAHCKPFSPKIPFGLSCIQTKSEDFSIVIFIDLGDLFTVQVYLIFFFFLSSLRTFIFLLEIPIHNSHQFHEDQFERVNSLVIDIDRNGLNLRRKEIAEFIGVFCFSFSARF